MKESDREDGGERERGKGYGKEREGAGKRKKGKKTKWLRESKE